MGRVLRSDYKPFYEGLWFALKWIDFHSVAGECAVTIRTRNSMDL